MKRPSENTVSCGLAVLALWAMIAAMYLLLCAVALCIP